jgi:hypothetical protein
MQTRAEPALSSAAMQWRPHRGRPRVAGPLAALLALSALLLSPLGTAFAGGTAFAAAAPAGPTATTGVALAAARRVERYWTPARMRSARPFGLAVGRHGDRARLGAPEATGATASFKPVPTPEVPPYSVEGRVFLRRGGLRGYCSGTAINSPTRQLVLTAGHCVNSGDEPHEHGVWSNYLEFVPAYNGGIAPFGAFVGRRDKVRAPKQWVKHGNPDFDMGAFLTFPNSEGIDVADAVGGGATIVADLSRHQVFQTFGYPGESTRMQSCQSPYLGDDLLSNPLPGPPTMAVGCRWAPGASGGGWLIDEGSEIDGINTYLHLNNRTRTYGPYFASENILKLVRGL